MTIIRELVIALGLDYDDTGAEEADASVDGLVTNVKKLGAALAGSAVVVGLRNLVQGTAEHAVLLQRQAVRLGTTTEELQAMGLAAASAGRDVEDVVDAMSTLQERARDAVIDPKSDPAEQLRLLGVSARDANGELKSGPQLFAEVADGIAGMGNQTDRVGAVMTLFGDVGRELLPMLQNGSAGLDEFRRAARDLGGGLSGDVIEQSAELVEQQTRLDFVMLGLKSSILVEILPAIISLAEGFTETVAGVSALLENTHFIEAALVALGIVATVVGVKMFIAFFPIIAVAALVALGVFTVIAVIDDLITLFSGGQSVIGDFLDALFGVGTAEAVVMALKDTWEQFVGVLSDAWDFMVKLGQAAGLVDGPETSRAEQQNGAAARFEAERDALRAGVAVRERGGSIAEQREAVRRARAEVGLEHVTATGAARRGSGGAVVQNQNTVNLNVSGNPSRAELERMRRTVADEMERRDRATSDALVEAGA